MPILHSDIGDRFIDIFSTWDRMKEVVYRSAKFGHLYLFYKMVETILMARMVLVIRLGNSNSYLWLSKDLLRQKIMGN